MHYPNCYIPCPGVFGGIVTRPVEVAATGAGLRLTTQTLVARGWELCPLTGASAHGGLELGPPLQLVWQPWLAVPSNSLFRFRSPIWDPHSCSVYMLAGHALVRLSADNTLTVVAGAVDEFDAVDGPGESARFCCPQRLASDGAGALFLLDGEEQDCVRKLQLPPVVAAGPGLGAHPAAAGAGGTAAVQVAVSTLPLQLPRRPDYLHFWFNAASSDAGGGSLICATEHAIYRLPLGGAAAAAPVLLAGAEEVRGSVDGEGPDARFNSITGLVVDGEGAVWATDSFTNPAVRRVALDGTVTTVTTVPPARCPAILPSGRLVLRSGEDLHVLDLGLKPQPLRLRAAPPGRTLPGDFGALLDRQPDGTADVTVVVGGRSFQLHRLVLLTRSDYFRQRFEGGFADGGAQQLELPDADPDVFALVVLFVYGGTVDIPLTQAQAVAELADRLLLPELRQLAVGGLLAGVTTDTVVCLLLWAEARGPAFAQLLSRLKAWYVEHHEAVLEEALDTVERLAASPRLVAELMRECARASKRLRTMELSTMELC